jgi:AcrR family transcriptional regulator
MNMFISREVPTVNGSARLTPKGERTREHILDTALDLFIGKGYDDTTMRDIATAAECSIGLTYRYFARKEDLVIALYRRLAQDLDAQVQQLAPDTVAVRFEQIMRIRLAQIRPYRALFTAILGAVLSPQNDLGVLGRHTDDVRAQEQGVFLRVVQGATDAPQQRQTDDLALVLYAAHLCLLLFWFYDRSPDARATDELLRLARDMLGLMRRLLRLPPIAGALERLARTICPVFRPEADAD